MHITLTVNSHETKTIKLPQANLHLIQSFVYSILPPEHSVFLHNTGYVVDGRPMKLFALSWLQSEKFSKCEDGKLNFTLPARIVISTPIAATIDGIADGALREKSFRIGNNKVYCESIDAKQMQTAGKSVIVQTLSPITCYSQMQRKDGRKYTVYFTPFELDFSESIYNNLIRKFQALYPEREKPKEQVSIEPLGYAKEKIAKFNESNSFPVKGWHGTFKLTGPEDLLQIGIDCGLGAKNSSGWGCVEVKDR